MKLLFKQKMFSWFDNYDIFGENGEIVYKVKGQLAWGHCLKVYDALGREVGMVKEKVFAWFPTFFVYVNGQIVGQIRRKFSWFMPKFEMQYCGWEIVGNAWEWNYTVKNRNGETIAFVDKKLWKWTDTYEIDVLAPNDALNVLMLVLAIDAEKCSREN